MQNLFSYPLAVDDLTTAEKHYHLKASPEQLEYIGEVLKVAGARALEANLRVKYNKKAHLLKVWGKVTAELELTSVISLENFVKTYEPEFEIYYDTQTKPEEQEEVEFDIDDETPEVVIDGQINLADIALEQVALAIDDFPRKEGEVFEFKSEFDEETTEKAHPFAALSQLKK